MYRMCCDSDYSHLLRILHGAKGAPSVCAAGYRRGAHPRWLRFLVGVDYGQHKRDLSGTCPGAERGRERARNRDGEEVTAPTMIFNVGLTSF